MPLLDHFHPPLSKRRHWESFHGSWATFIASDLNRRPLPRGYVAEPHVKVGVEIESDLGTFEEDEPEDDRGGATATAVWAPPKPPLAVPVDLDDLEVVEVQVYDDEMARKLVAAVELVSPANKDRPTHRRAFVAKCAAYLQGGVSVVVVDVVTHRRHNFHADLMEFLDVGEAATRAVTAPLYAAAYRTRKVRKQTRLEAWPTALALGKPLPVVPLWLSARTVLPLDLETTYQTTCDAFAIGA